jgi:hypothetical protein
MSRPVNIISRPVNIISRPANTIFKNEINNQYSKKPTVVTKEQFAVKHSNTIQST